MAALGEARGRQELYAGRKPEVLATLRQAALIESSESSNRIEGVTAPRARIEQLVQRSTAPRDRSEQEIAGYRDALALIHEAHEDVGRPGTPALPMPFRPNVLLQLHGLLYRYQPGTGGRFKSTDNEIVERARRRSRPPGALPSDAGTRHAACHGRVGRGLSPSRGDRRPASPRCHPAGRTRPALHPPVHRRQRPGRPLGHAPASIPARACRRALHQPRADRRGVPRDVLRSVACLVQGLARRTARRAPVAQLRLGRSAARLARVRGPRGVAPDRSREQVRPRPRSHPPSRAALHGCRDRERVPRRESRVGATRAARVERCRNHSPVRSGARGEVGSRRPA